VECYNYTISELKESEKFLENIRWDMTPKKFLASDASLKESGGDTSGGSMIKYMLYVDINYNKPALMIMRTRGAMSKTVGYVEDVSEDLLKEAMGCNKDECEAGMYPLTQELEAWLKKELGIEDSDG
jgi:hypothetical protein